MEEKQWPLALGISPTVSRSGGGAPFAFLTSSHAWPFLVARAACWLAAVRLLMICKDGVAESRTCRCACSRESVASLGWCLFRYDGTVFALGSFFWIVQG